MNIKYAVIIAAALFTTSAFGQSEGERLATLAFKSVDENSDGFISMEEYQAFGLLVFVSMDANDDGELTFEEFGSWDFGMVNIAEDTGRVQAYETARRIVFDLWDRSFDWRLTRAENRRGHASDFFSSDENRDGRLSVDEHLRYSIYNVTLRSALEPDG